MAEGNEEGRETEGFEEESQVKMPFTKEDTYSQYAAGVPPAKPAPRPLDQEDEAAIAAVVGEQTSPGPGPQEQEQLAQAQLMTQGPGKPPEGPGQETDERPPSERESGVMTTSSDEMVDLMQESQQSSGTLGNLTSDAAGERAMEEQPEEGR